MVTIAIADKVNQGQPGRPRHLPNSARADIAYAGAQFADSAMPGDGKSGQLRLVVTTTPAETWVVLDLSAQICVNGDKEQTSLCELNDALSEISQLQLAEEEIPNN